MSLRIEETDLLDADVRVFNIRNLKRVDAFIVLLTLVLAFVGVLTQYSASYGASSVLGTETEKSTFSQIFWKLFTGYSGKQIGFLGIGVLCAVVVACLDYRFLVAIGPVVYIVIVAMLVLTLFSPLGYAVRGARRWLDLGLIRIQPSEFSKLGLIFVGVVWFESRSQVTETWLFVVCVCVGCHSLWAYFLAAQPKYSGSALTRSVDYAVYCRVSFVALLSFGTPGVVSCDSGY